MDEIAPETVAETPKKAPAKPKAKRRKSAARKYIKAGHVSADPPVLRSSAHEFAGMTPRACPAACTAERCVVSTVNICKHPSLTADSGCGPVTLRNRERARRYLKHQAVDRE